MAKKKRTYVVTVRTSYEDTLHIEASSVKEAKKLAIEEFSNYAIHISDTEVVYVGIQGGEQ